jgi:hypothetical protein
MNIDLEERLIESMRHEAGGVILTSDVLGRATRRHRRRTTAIRTVSALGVAGLAGVLVAGLTSGGTTAPRPPAANQAQPVAMRLAGATAASDDISYRMRLRTGFASGPGPTYEGAFDPRTDTGYVRRPQDDSVTTELLINGTRYIGGEPPLRPLPADKGRGEKYGRYGQYSGKHDSLSLYAGTDPVLSAATPDPASLRKALRNATVTENPDGTMHFQYSTKWTAKFGHGSSTTTGDVTLDRDGRIAKVTTKTGWEATVPGKRGPQKGTATATLELFDYGTPVTVKRPKDVVPAS